MATLAEYLHIKSKSISEYIPESGCVFSYPGIMGGGTSILDASSYRNDGVITGAEWRTTSSGIWYLYFNGVNQKITPGTNGNDTEFDITGTISFGAWVNTDSLGVGGMIICRDDTGARNYSLSISSSNTVYGFIFSGGTAYEAQAVGVTNKRWHLVGLSYDKVTVRTYLNGIRGTQETACTGAIDNDDVPLYIGLRGDSGLDILGGIAHPFLKNENMNDFDWMQKFERERGLFDV